MAIFTSISHLSPSPVDILLPNMTLRTLGCVCMHVCVPLSLIKIIFT